MDTLTATLLPEALSAGPAALLIAASFFTSALTAAIGLGGGLFMLALMGLFMPVAALIPVHGAVQLGSNAGRAWHRRAYVDFTIAVPIIAGSLVGTAVGGALVIQLPDPLLKLTLGAFVLAMTWMKVPGFGRLSQAGLAVGSGVIALISVFVGATGPLLAALFGQVFSDDRKRMVATLAAGMSVHHALKIVVFAIAGFAFADWLALIALMVATGYVGTIFGSKLLDRLPEKSFRIAFRAALTLLALDLLRRGLMALL